MDASRFREMGDRDLTHHQPEAHPMTTDRLAFLTPWRWTVIGYANAMLTIIAIAAVVLAVKA